MKTRILPPEEWAKLDGTALGPAWRSLPTSGVTIIVVEEEDGLIAGHWTVFTCLHAENVWVAPQHQKRGVVVGRLLKGMQTHLQTLGVGGFVTAAASEEVRRLLEHHLGATRLPGDAYSVPVRG